MPWSNQNTEISTINKYHFYKKHDGFFFKYVSLCGHFYLGNITSNRKPTENKCKICNKIKNGNKK
jgi:hypothetical protein